MQMPYGGPPPQKSGALKWLGIGCGLLMMLSCMGGAVAFFLAKGALGPGTEVGTTFVYPGMPYTLTYTQGANETKVWLDIDLSYAQSLQVTGPVMVRSNGTPIAQYNLQLTGGSCASPVRESNSSFCINWVSSEVNGNGSVSGKTRMFSVPRQPRGAVITVSGMAFATPGFTMRRLRMFAAE